MKLSEAIRKGCKVRPRQCFGRFLDGDDGACAGGAALIAAGISPDAIECEAEYAPWPIEAGPAFPDGVNLLTESCPAPRCNIARSGGVTVRGIAAHLNDTHRWSREQIADWLEAQGW